MADRSHERPPDSAIQGAVQPRYGEVSIRNRGRLPHWDKEEGLYFITMHLGDSLPEKAIRGLIERQRILIAAKNSGASLLPEQRVLVEKYCPRQIEAFFDRGSGECVFKHPSVAQEMAETLRFWHGKRYRLIAWCVMPNHVHVVCRLLPGQNLPEIVKSWKVYSARAANRILGRSGPLWQREYYDRLIRREGEFDRAVEYVLNNPRSAGLANWKWVWCEGREALTTAGLETGGP